MFKGIRIWRVELPFRFAFSHNLAVRDRAETLIVQLWTAAGFIGHGQALPRPYLTGESVESVLADIKERWWPKLSAMTMPASADFMAGMAALEPLYRQADGARKNASYAAIEMAALDAFARERGMPAWMGRQDSAAAIPLVGVITAGSPGMATWLARALKWLGYRRFKVKVGKDADADRRRLEAVRKAIGPDAWLAVDANQAWQWDEAVQRLEGLRTYGISLAEEPLAGSLAADADYAELEKEAGVPLMADETLCTLADAERLVERGGPSWWNVRFGKNGGFNGVRALAALAKKHNVRVYSGVLVGETSVLAAAGRAAMFGTNAECAEYGFPRVFLRHDPFRGGPGGWRGTMAPISRGVKGLGVSCLDSALVKWEKPIWSNGDFFEK